MVFHPVLQNGPQEVGIGMLGAGVLTMLGAFLVVFLVVGLALYIYMALAMMPVARRTNTDPAWLAFIPIANLYLMSKMAGMHWWPVLLVVLFFIPFVSMIAGIILYVFMIIWQWRICEIRRRPGWWSLITIIPIIGAVWQFVMWGTLAWGE